MTRDFSCQLVPICLCSSTRWTYFRHLVYIHIVYLFRERVQKWHRDMHEGISHKWYMGYYVHDEFLNWITRYDFQWQWTMMADHFDQRQFPERRLIFVSFVLYTLTFQQDWVRTGLFYKLSIFDFDIYFFTESNLFSVIDTIVQLARSSERHVSRCSRFREKWEFIDRNFVTAENISCISRTRTNGH